MHFEDHLHVVGGAAASNSTVEILVGRGGNEVVVLAGSELKTSGSRCEGSEGDGEVHETVRTVADGHNLGFGVGDSARIVFLTTHTVDHMPLRVSVARL